MTLRCAMGEVSVSPRLGEPCSLGPTSSSPPGKRCEPSSGNQPGRRRAEQLPGHAAARSDIIENYQDEVRGVLGTLTHASMAADTDGLRAALDLP